jgi:voltage-gated potassium channel
MTTTVTRLRSASMMVAFVLVGGVVGYRLLGLSTVDAIYQTVITLTTVGFREVEEFDTGLKVFTIFLIVIGVGTVLYTFTLVVQMVVEGQLREILGRRRMDRKIAELNGHVVICGWGRVGRAVALDLEREGRHVVVIDSNRERLADVTLPTIVGDATHDDTLRAAGIERAHSLVAALAADADNLFITLSGRSLNPGLFIVARARQDESVDKLARAGADRVVNPQELGAARIASFVVRPHVAEFVDVVMHERSMEFRLQEVEILPNSPLVGRTLGEADLRAASGSLVLAIRDSDGSFATNPDPGVVLQAHQVVIAVGTAHDLHALDRVVNPG